MRRLAAALSVLAVTLLGWGGASAAPIGRKMMSHIGLWTQFDRRGYPNGYWQGNLIQHFDEQDPVVSHSYREEAALQLDKMKALGLRHITYELRTADPSTANSDGTCSARPYPACQVCYSLGLDWPQPTTKEITNLKAFLDLLQSKGFKLDLLLTTTHMEEPPANGKKWLGAIFDAVKGHPALELIMLGGDAHHVDSNNDGVMDACGTQAGEAPLFLGPTSYAAKYLEWAIPFAMSRGIPANQLSAESTIGHFFLDSQAPAGQNATDHHLWKPIGVMKTIFDKLAIKPSSRVYAASFYEQNKCSDAQGLPCTDQDAHHWAEDRLKDAITVIGTTNAKRLIVTEGGSAFPQTLPVEQAYESLGYLLSKYGTGGANFWRWSAFEDSEELDPSRGQAVKQRGVDFTYLPPSKEIIDLGGFHLDRIPNGSFERGAGKPASWTIAGVGSGRRYHLAAEAGQPQVPSRGDHSLRLITGAASATVTATSAFVPVSPNRTYTTTANLRFAWSGDPNPSGAAETRPQVFATFNYYDAAKQPSAVKSSDVFRYFQENGAPDFATFPMQYRTPGDARFLRIVIGAARNGLPGKIILDADNLR